MGLPRVPACAVVGSCVPQDQRINLPLFSENTTAQSGRDARAIRKEAVRGSQHSPRVQFVMSPHVLGTQERDSYLLRGVPQALP